MLPGIALTPNEVVTAKAKIVAMISESVHGTFTHACKAAGISRTKGYELIAADPQFKIDVDKAREKSRESLMDFAESKLVQAMRAGNVTAIIFALKCIGKPRGWIDRFELEMKSTVTNNTNIAVTHDATNEFRQMLSALADAKATGGKLPLTLDQPSAAEPDNAGG